MFDGPVSRPDQTSEPRLVSQAVAAIPAVDARSPMAATPAAKPAKSAPTRATRSLSAGYLAGWGGVGALAFGYLAFSVATPDGRAALGIVDTKIESTAMAEQMGRTMTDVDALKKTVGSLEQDMARVKIGAVAADAREKALTERVGGVETRLDQFVTTVTSALPSGRLAAASAAQQAKASAVAVKAPATQTAPIPSSPLQGAPIQTGSLPQAADAEAKSQPMAVSLASGPSLDALRLSWSLLTDRHKGTLKSLEPRVLSTGPGAYQLVAGPIASATEAQKVCSALRAKGVVCQPTEFKGEGL